jgi:hypothetical protein
MTPQHEPTPEPTGHGHPAQLTSAEIVFGLREILGARLVAYISSVSSSQPIGEWANGTNEPSLEKLERLRTAYSIAMLVREREGAATVQSWFQGMNPRLGDQAPARVLRDQPIGVALPEVMAAARFFAYVG